MFFGTLGYLAILISITTPLIAVSYPLLIFQSNLSKLGWISIAPFMYCFIFALSSGLISRIFARAIVPGKFPRNKNHFVYGPRSVYGSCWSLLYYSGPIYFLTLTFLPLRKFIFRLFGYKGSLNFTVYPDTWIRDLPLLNFATGTYLSNKATLGTNLCLKDGDILVGRITTGPRAVIGHLAIIGLDSTLGEEGELGIDVAFGLRCKMGNNSKIAPSSAVNHGAVIGNNVSIGAATYIGVKTIIKDNIRIAAGANISAGTIIESQADADAIFSSESTILVKFKDELFKDNRHPSPDAKSVAGVAQQRKE